MLCDAGMCSKRRVSRKPNVFSCKLQAQGQPWSKDVLILDENGAISVLDTRTGSCSMDFQTQSSRVAALSSATVDNTRDDPFWIRWGSALCSPPLPPDALLSPRLVLLRPLPLRSGALQRALPVWGPKARNLVASASTRPALQRHCRAQRSGVERITTCMVLEEEDEVYVGWSKGGVEMQSFRPTSASAVHDISMRRQDLGMDHGLHKMFAITCMCRITPSALDAVDRSGLRR